MFSLFSAYPTFMIFLGVAIAMVITMVLMPAWIRFLKTSHICLLYTSDAADE